MFSKFLRRSHMYLALFLTPWMLIYALSAMTMNHREFFKNLYGEAPVQFEKVTEQVYTGLFPGNAKPREAALQILKALDLDGAFSVQGKLDGEHLIVFRQDPITPRRITYTPKDGKLVVERQIFRMPPFLERMHRRRGFQQDYVADDAWAFSVDLVVVAMAFWVLSGIWMWWGLRSTRGWGALSLVAGAGLFALFLVLI